VFIKDDHVLPMSMLKVLPMCVPGSLPNPLLHKTVEEREKTESPKK
jgi:hypothetical protein